MKPYWRIPSAEAPRFARSKKAIEEGMKLSDEAFARLKGKRRPGEGETNG